MYARAFYRRIPSIRTNVHHPSMNAELGFSWLLLLALP